MAAYAGMIGQIMSAAGAMSQGSDSLSQQTGSTNFGPVAGNGQAYGQLLQMLNQGQGKQDKYKHRKKAMEGYIDYSQGWY